jgi:hypothetical protein
VSWIDVALAAERSQARLTLEHTAIIEDHWNQFGPGAVGIGWDLAIAGLERYLATGASVDHETAEAWMVSPDGKAFMSQSGEFWRAAHVASGVDPTSAKERLGPHHRVLSRRAGARYRPPGHRKLMHVFEVLSDPVRRRILELLGPGEMASGEVVEAIGSEFGITQAAVSQHLKVLREGGFARVRADGAATTLFGGCRRSSGRWTHGSASSGVFGSRSWTRWRRRSREASVSGVNAPLSKRTGKRA